MTQNSSTKFMETPRILWYQTRLPNYLLGVYNLSVE